MYNATGFTENYPFTCSISYDDFRNGLYFSCYDLSTSSRCSSAGLVPSIRNGHLRLDVEFSESLSMDISCIMYAEFPATVFLNKKGRSVTGTFTGKLYLIYFYNGSFSGIYKNFSF